MILHVATLLTFQLIGEVLSRALSLPVPGPVIGMGLLLLAFVALPKAASAVSPTAQGLLSHLSLLFVPAGVGVISHAKVLSETGPALAVALVASTLLAMVVAALVFVGLARWTGTGMSNEGEAQK
jgi:putative effector of murein hydrolase LrgA (UPF0299 family)